FTGDVATSGVSGEPPGRAKVYETELEVMRSKESTTMFVDFNHVMLFDDALQAAIAEDFL
ncbi:hypothetical protein GOP47_0030825, partial [Adiantum capillus-veneris]